MFTFRSLKDGKYYIGETSDVPARMNFHNSGRQRSTKGRIPFELIKVEEYTDRSDALKREKQIKSWKGGTAFQTFISEL